MKILLYTKDYTVKEEIWSGFLDLKQNTWLPKHNIAMPPKRKDSLYTFIYLVKVTTFSNYLHMSPANLR